MSSPDKLSYDSSLDYSDLLKTVLKFFLFFNFIYCSEIYDFSCLSWLYSLLSSEVKFIVLFYASFVLLFINFLAFTEALKDFDKF
jgi:hypothetical protein